MRQDKNVLNVFVGTDVIYIKKDYEVKNGKYVSLKVNNIWL